MNRLIMYFIYFLILSSVSVQSKTFIPDRFQLTFTKELKSLLGKKKTSEGVLAYQHPGKIRIEQRKPFYTIYVSNGSQAWLYSAPLDPTKEKGEVTVLNPQKIPLAEAFNSLRKGLVSNKVYNVSRQGAIFTLTFLPKSKERFHVESVSLEMKTAQASLSFSNIKNLAIKSERALEKYQLISISLPESFPGSHFNFKVTDKMKVTEAR